jgi:hypothetical protein
MSPELDKKLCSKYPKIFRDRHSDVRETAMSFGIECDDGWYTLLDNACYLIQNHIDRKRADRARILQIVRRNGVLSEWQKEVAETKAPRQLVAVQVKEKFGSLRLYTFGGDDYTDGVERMAESMSAHTCEGCGNLGSMNRDGWIKCLCPSCRKERDES